MNMKVNRVRHLLVLTSILCLMPITFAAWSQSNESQGKEGKTVTITGCIAKGEAADEFAITQNGKKYGLKSTNCAGCASRNSPKPAFRVSGL